jgi:hypothetical protein
MTNKILEEGNNSDIEGEKLANAWYIDFAEIKAKC